MKMFLAGEWVDRPRMQDVGNPYDDSVVGSVPKAGTDDVERALAFAERGAAVTARMTAYERWSVLTRAAALLAEQVDELGTLISSEEGKILAEGKGEVRRAVETMTASAEEAKRLHGETVQMDVDPAGAMRGRGSYWPV